MVNGKRHGEDLMTGETLHLTAAEIVDTTAPYDLVSRMRASFWVIGPLLARTGEARVSLPGGCAIGTRPVDFFLEALAALGAEIDIDAGYVVARARNGLAGGRIVFPKVTVGATHVAMMAAALARGETVIDNAAREPEIVDVADCLIKMGARIEGAGTATIRIEGVPALHGARHAVLPDRIEAGTYAFAVAMTGGDVVLEGARADCLENPLATLRQVGAEVTVTNDGIRVYRNGRGLAPVQVTTEPFPGFPTDLQAQLMALVCRAGGTSTIRETIFENRFMHVQELARLGADIALDGQVATVTGVERLKGAPVMATDLRASVSLVIAGLAAEGVTTVNRVYHLDRGFERLEEKLSRCGARIERQAAA
jgi:UDP-N-acetylglucosamine 1-carboxyvinyltransferase